MNDWRLELEEHQVSFLMVYADVYQAGKTSMSQGEYIIAGRTLDLMAHGSWCMVENTLVVKVLHIWNTRSHCAWLDTTRSHSAQCMAALGLTV